MSRRPLLRALRALPARWHRPLAKVLFNVSGWLSRVRTYQSWYEIVGDPVPEIGPTQFRRGGWHWSSCALSTRVLGLSMQLDWDHWDCWALRHEDCDPQPCQVCGGCRCAQWQDDEEDGD